MVNKIESQNLENMANIEDALMSFIRKSKKTEKQVEEYAKNLFCWYYPNASNDLLLKFKIYCMCFKDTIESKDIILKYLNNKGVKND